MQILEERFNENKRPFDEIFELATQQDVFIGCSCPTNKNPDVYHCHTIVALRLMAQKYADLEVMFPANASKTNE